MKIMLTKPRDVHDYRDWLTQTVHALGLSQDLNAKLVAQLCQRDQLGSVQIAEQVVMPHVVCDALPDSWLVVSQLPLPIRYLKIANITTGIYIFARPHDSSVSQAIDCLTDEDVITALRNPQLSVRQLTELFS